MYGTNPHQLPGLPEIPGVNSRSPVIPNLPVVTPSSTNHQTDTNLILAFSSKLEQLERRLESAENRERILQEELQRLRNSKVLEGRSSSSEKAINEIMFQLKQLTVHAQSVERSVAAAHSEILSRKDKISNDIFSLKSEIQQMGIAKESIEKSMTHLITDVKDTANRLDQLQMDVKEVNLRSRLDSRLAEASKSKPIQIPVPVGTNTILEDKVVELTSSFSQLTGKLELLEIQTKTMTNNLNEVKIDTMKSTDNKIQQIHEKIHKEVEALEKSLESDRRSNIAKTDETDAKINGLNSQIADLNRGLTQSAENFKSFKHATETQLKEIAKISVLQTKIDKIFADLDQRLRLGLASLQQDFGLAKNSEKSQNSLTNNIQQEIAKIRSVVDGLRDTVTIKMSDLENEVRHLNEKLQTTSTRVGELQKEMENRINKPNEEVLKLKADLEELKFSQQRLRKQMDELISSKTNDALLKQIENLRSEIGQIKLKLSKLA